MSASFPLVATCPPNLRPFVMAELQRLGIAATDQRLGATFDGDADRLARACLWLGCASAVHVPIATFRCRALGELQRKATELPWRDWLTARVPIRLTARSHRSRVYHTGGIAERVLRGIATSLGKEPTLANEHDERFAPLRVLFDDDTCTILLDVTSAPLHRRGYRLDVRKAPLREDIARAMLLACDLEPDEAVLDPFCGSGTIAIEAATMQAGLAPGRLLEPPLVFSPRCDTDAWQRALAEQRPAAPAAPIAASDRDEGAVAAARANAERAGVADRITCEHHALAAQPWWQPDRTPGRGVVVTNPPYGKRVRGKGSLVPLYQTLGHRIRSLGDGWRAVVLTQDVRLARRTGLDLTPIFTTQHGGIQVTALATSRP